MASEKREYNYISFQERQEIINAAYNKNESIKAWALRLGVKYITAKQIVKRYRETGKIETKGCKKEDTWNKKKRKLATNSQTMKMTNQYESLPSTMKTSFNMPCNGYINYPVDAYQEQMVLNELSVAQMEGMNMMPQGMITAYPIIPMVQPAYFYMPCQPLNNISVQLNNELLQELNQELGQRMMNKFEQ